jgi:predicted permease
MSENRNLWRRFQSWLLAILQRSRAEREMDAELRFHIEAYADDLMRSGIPGNEAQRRARIEFGGLERAKEECRDARGVHFVDTLFEDLRYGLRILRASPGFALAAVLTIALGVGANAAIFGLINSAFLRGLPFHEPDRLVHIWTTASDGDTHTPTTSQYQAVLEESRSFQQIAAMGSTSFSYGADGSLLQNLEGLLVTPSWLPTLVVQPFLGRNFREDEQIEGRDTEAILSYSCWRELFHSDSHIVGKQIVLNRRLVTVIGVLPQSLVPYYPDIDLFAPLVLSTYANRGYVRTGKTRVQIVARLKPGTTLAEAGSETEVIGSRIKQTDAPTNRPDRLIVEDFTELLRNPGPTMQNARRGLWMTAVAAGIVLLIACTNVAGLLLARGVKRHREIAVRTALGCSRSRMIRQLLTENMLLFLCGGAAAVVATRWCSEAITKMASGILPGAYLDVDGRVFAVTLGISFLSSLAFGMIPALQATRTDLNESLQDRAPTTPGGTRARKWRNALVAAQIALGMLLFVVFGLLIRSFLNVQNSPLGYDARNILTATVHLPAARYTQPSDKQHLMRDTVEQMRRLPGVESVGIADSLPMEGADSGQIRIEAPSPGSAPRETELWFVSVSPDYFSTMRIPMVTGRPFQQADSSTGGEVAIINQAFAKQYFPGISPVGYHLASADSPTKWKEIVGVVSDFRQRNPEEDIRPLAYFPIAQTSPLRWSLAIRVHPTSDLGKLAASAGAWLRPVDPELYWQVSSMDRLFQDSESMTMRRPILALLGCFGGLAMILVVVGVYGVTSYSVAERTKEIGIRVALGASNREVAGLVLRESLTVALLGLAVGTFWAFAIAHFFPTSGIGWSGSGIFLYNVSRADGLTYIAAGILLIAVVSAATWAPARRATHLDPMVALRHE